MKESIKREVRGKEEISKETKHCYTIKRYMCYLSVGSANTLHLKRCAGGFLLV